MSELYIFSVLHTSPPCGKSEIFTPFMGGGEVAERYKIQIPPYTFIKSLEKECQPQQP